MTSFATEVGLGMQAVDLDAFTRDWVKKAIEWEV